MKSILKNSNGNAISVDGKLLGKPEGANPLQTLVTGRSGSGGYYLFMRYTGKNVDFLSEIDFSKNATCYHMFDNCYNLETIPLFDTSKVTNMSNMFYNCTNLPTIPQLDTSKVTDMSNMFYMCTNLISIPKLDTSNVTNMSSMFHNCIKLTTIDITSMDKITSTSSSNSFASACYSLTKLIIRTMTVIPTLNTKAINTCYHFTGTVNSTYNPNGLKDGRIYVPDDMVDQLKQATTWSAYGDIIVPLSTLEE